MANSKYEYVRLFEQPDILLANTWIVVRIDGRGFSKLTTKYKFVKPNDRDALDLMNAAARAVMKELPDLVLAYGNSDEFSFVFHKDCVLFERRASKLTTTITSTFTSYYVFLWSQYFPDKPLTAPLPTFDGRAVCYPSDFNLRDYMSWRQVDCHINNLYNTTFWTLVQQGGMDPRDAEQRLSGTVSSDKNELLFKEFGINYNNEPDCFKKGTVLYRDFFPTSAVEPALSAQPHVQPLTIVSPQPKGIPARRATRAAENAIPFLQDQTVSPASADPGPTFLSTTSTPSPPPSPPAMSRPTFPNPLRSNPVSPRTSTYPPIAMPLSPPNTATWPMGNSMYVASGIRKQSFPSLIPLPLSPPILKPSTKPPLSLNAPNPTTRTNFSPTSPVQDVPADFPISGYNHARRNVVERPPSHSASASLTMPLSSTPQPTGLKQRSPSQPHLPSYFNAGNSQQAPVIPLRMSSIPANTQPRKLSLPVHRSTSSLEPSNGHVEKEASAQAAGLTTPRRLSPPLRTDKALPSPPMNVDEETRTRERVRGGSPPSGASSLEWPMPPTSRESPPRRDSETYKRGGHVWFDQTVEHSGIAELPANSAAYSNGHARLHSAPNVSLSLGQPFQMLDVEASRPSGEKTENDMPPTAPLKSSPPSKSDAKNPTIPSRTKSKSKPPSTSERYKSSTPHASSEQHPAKSKSNLNSTDAKKLAANLKESGGWAAGTHQDRDRGNGELSRTQRDKDRKKRSKAAVLIEHVDIIRDEFWEKRPWILSGRTG